MTASDDCLFCKIIAGDIPGDIVLITDDVVAFRDVNPVAPTHVLVVPRDHATNAAETAAADPALSAPWSLPQPRSRRAKASMITGWCSTPAPGSARACSTPTSTSWGAGR